MDVYYSPEKFGLTPIAEIDYSSGHYEFDIRCVWKHENGKLLTARDSGCSCPSPFEDYSDIESLEEVNIDSLVAEVNSATEYTDPLQRKEFLKTVKDAM